VHLSRGEDHPQWTTDGIDGDMNFGAQAAARAAIA